MTEAENPLENARKLLSSTQNPQETPRIAEKIAVFGSFGYGNIGDEAVPVAFGRMARAAGIDRPILPISRFAKAVMPDVCYRTDVARLRAEHRSEDTVFVVGGGGIEPGPHSCLNRAEEMLHAIRPASLLPFAISVEPGVDFGFFERRKLRRLLRDLPEILVRDELSQTALARLVDSVPIRVIGDIVLWLEPEVLPAPEAETLPERYIAVTLADIWKDPAFFDWVARELARIARDLQASVLLVPISTAVGKDIAQHAALCDRLVADFATPARLMAFDGYPVPAPGWIAKIYSQAELVISSRLHGCVISYAQKTPFVGISYHPKLAGFAQTVGWDAMVVPHQLPRRQSAGAYGFALSDLRFQEGMLVTASRDAVACTNFTAREYFRMKQLQAFTRYHACRTWNSSRHAPQLGAEKASNVPSVVCEGEKRASR